MKKLFLIMLLGLLLIGNIFPLVNADFGTLDTQIPAKVNNSYIISQTCFDATYINISIINLNGIVLFNKEMINNGTNWIYNFTPTKLGYHDISYLSDGCSKSGTSRFLVSINGEDISQNQSLMIIGLIAIICLFVILGFSFRVEKWKVRGFFFMLASLMGVITLNSIKIIASSSSDLNKMMEVGLILGIIVLLFLFLYFFVYAMIEVFSYFRKNKQKTWDFRP